MPRFAPLILVLLALSAGAAEAENGRKPMKFLFYGDSITGWSDLSKWFKFSHIVECMVEARSGPGRCVVYNRGIGGNTSGDMLARFDRDVLAVAPDLVVLLAGANDGNLGESSIANMDQLISRLKTICPRVLLLQYHLTMPPGTKPEEWQRGFDGVDRITTAAERYKLPLLDLAPIFLAARDDSVPSDEADYRKLNTWQGALRYRTSDLVGMDGIHLNGGGEMLYARSIFAKLLELGWLPER